MSGPSQVSLSQTSIMTEETKEYVTETCPACFEEYDYVTHYKVLMDCKHYVCQSCFNDIKAFASLGCPLCNKKSQSKKITKKPKNSRKIAPMPSPAESKAQRILRYKLRFIMVGEDQVGITSLLNRVCNQTYIPEHYKTDCISTRKMRLTQGLTQVYIKFREAPTGERLSYFLNEDPSKYAGVILCVDLTSRYSFESLEKWHSVIRKTKWRHVTTILVGTKSDLFFKRAVSTEDAVSWADLKGYQYCETSAKTGLNVDETFYNLIQNTLHLSQRVKEQSPVYSLKRTKKNSFKKRM